MDRRRKAVLWRVGFVVNCDICIHLIDGAGTSYDFAANDPSVNKRRLTELTSAQEKLSKRVNMKVMSMYEKAEKEYQELLSKKKIVEQDKAKVGD